MQAKREEEGELKRGEGFGNDALAAACCEQALSASRSSLVRMSWSGAMGPSLFSAAVLHLLRLTIYISHVFPLFIRLPPTSLSFFFFFICLSLQLPLMPRLLSQRSCLFVCQTSSSLLPFRPSESLSTLLCHSPPIPIWVALSRQSNILYIYSLLITVCF